ncbi:MAG: Restriction endonuclease fold toxin 9 [Blastocatellia bacterium]|nr:Restriction endonuclease fold toxin 9 [Blastocatellia bacterium]
MKVRIGMGPMKLTSHLIALGLLVLVLGAATYSPSRTTTADEWEEYYKAERAAKDLLYTYEDFKTVSKTEIEKLVAAICDADEDERREVSRTIGEQAADKTNTACNNVEQRKKEALDMLTAVIADKRFESKRSDAERLKYDVEDKYPVVASMCRSLRGSNHPVVSYMLDKGKEEDDYRKGRCTASQVDTGNGFADCVGYDGNMCLIVEFKPNNSRAIRKGLEQLRDYKDGLQNNASKRQDLNNKNSAFATCQTFDTRVDCYRLCPEIESDGNFRSRSTEWSTNCR